MSENLKIFIGWEQMIIGCTDYGFVFKERAIVRMTYVDSPLVFMEAVSANE